jgi:hypothetical protein
MALSRTRLYLFFIVACAVGYSWLIFNLGKPAGSGSGVNLCLVKHATGFACPSCGATRSFLAILEGEPSKAFFLNPFGYLLFILSILLPVWVAFDLITRRSSLFEFFLQSEKVLRKKEIAWPLVLLVLANWVWNIQKGL